MRRLGIYCLLVFLGGIVSTVLSAWLFAGFDHNALRRLKVTAWTDRTYSGGNGWYVREWAGRGRRSRLMQSLTDDGLWRPDPFDPPSWSVANHQAPQKVGRVLEHERGWPWLSLRCRWDEPTHDFIDPCEQLHGGLIVRAFSLDWLLGKEPWLFYRSIDDEWAFMVARESLPLIPIWPGFVASSLFNSAVWFVVVLALSSPGVLRRVRRKRKKRCIRCAYSLRGIDSAACPECGWQRASRFPLMTGGRLVTAAMLLVLLTLATVAFSSVHVRRIRHPGPMHLAARHNNVVTIRQLLERGSDVNEQLQEVDGPDTYAQWKSTPLMWAAAHGHTRAMRVLIDAGADVSSKASYDDRTPLLVAAGYGHAEAIKVLAETGADVNASDGWGETALHVAAFRGHARALEALIHAGADVHLATQDGDTALFSAARSGTPETVRILLAAGAEFNITQDNGWERTPLSAAASAGRIPNMKVLLEAGADAKWAGSNSPLASALSGGHAEAAMLLLDRGAPVDPSNGPQLWDAAEKNLTEVARVLLQRGADPNHVHPELKGWSPLRRAILRSNIELARMLVEAGADPHVVTDEGETILFWIDWEESSEQLIEFVLSLGIDINHQTAHGQTALSKAVYDGRAEAVRILLQAGADPHVTNKDGHSAVDYAQRPLPFSSEFMGFSEHEPDPQILKLILEAIEDE